MKKFLNILLISSLASLPLQICADELAGYTSTSSAWNTASSDLNIPADDNGTSSNSLERDDSITEKKPTLWKKINSYAKKATWSSKNFVSKIKNRGKSCGRWMKQNPKSSLMMLGGSAALGILAASRNMRKASKKLIVRGSKIAAPYGPKAKGLLRNRYFWYGTGLVSGGVGAYVYRKQISDAPRRWTQDTINAGVDALVHSLQRPEVDAAFRARGESLGAGITSGAVAHLADQRIQNSVVDAGGSIAKRTVQSLRSNWWVRSVGAAVTVWQVYNVAQPLFTWAGGII